MDHRTPPYTEWQVIPHGEDYVIFDSNYYGVNSGAQVALIPGAKLLGRCVCNTLEIDARMREGLQRLAAFIAAAPEMYALLKRIQDRTYDTLDDMGNGILALPYDVFEQIEPMLAKARGEEAEK